MGSYRFSVPKKRLHVLLEDWFVLRLSIKFFRKSLFNGSLHLNGVYSGCSSEFALLFPRSPTDFFTLKTAILFSALLSFRISSVPKAKPGPSGLHVSNFYCSGSLHNATGGFSSKWVPYLVYAECILLISRLYPHCNTDGILKCHTTRFSDFSCKNRL